MCSVSPATPGSRQQMPRTMSSHLHPCLGRRSELVDHPPLGDRVDLDADIAIRPLLHLLVDEGAELISDAVGGHQQLLVLPCQIIDQQVAEKANGVLADGFGGSHQAQVGIHGVGLFIVITGADLGDIAHFALVPKGDETNLAVALESLHAVHHLAAPPPPAAPTRPRCWPRQTAPAAP